jgi:hypothetical protein
MMWCTGYRAEVIGWDGGDRCGARIVGFGDGRDIEMGKNDGVWVWVWGRVTCKREGSGRIC